MFFPGAESLLPGPGSGSVWLQMGAFGPKRVAIPSDARDDGAPPYPIVDNPDALLDVTDMVFIDPPGTGFSVLLPGGEPKNYYGVQQDARAVAEVIRRWLGENGRWNSPKFIIGESYGTTRAAGLSTELADRGVQLNGIAHNASLRRVQDKLVVKPKFAFGRTRQVCAHLNVAVDVRTQNRSYYRSIHQVTVQSKNHIPFALIMRFTVSTTSTNASFFLYLTSGRRQLIAPVA